MIRVLLSAYACEPDRGSEPGVGWEWATRLARSHKVLVLTRANNQEVIEKKLHDQQWAENLSFVYYDLPRPILFLKKHKLIPVFIYYLLWQLGARAKGAEYFSEVDIVHHATFNGFRFPGAWWFVPKPVVLGPLGGASIARSEFKRCFGTRWIVESIRSLSVRTWQYNPWTISSLRNATKVMAVGEEMVERFKGEGIESESMLETALPRILEEDRALVPARDRRDFVLVGNLEPWKAWQIALEAFAHAANESGTSTRLKVIGTGKQLEWARSRARELGISDSVDFLGQLPREKTWEIVEQSRGMLFSSIRDTSGNVVLEAMGLGVPVVCFNHQGVGFITDDDCAFRIQPSTWDDAIDGFGNAITALRDDDELVERMSRAGRLRVTKTLAWGTKISRMSEIYRDLVEASGSILEKCQK